MACPELITWEKLKDQLLDPADEQAAKDHLDQCEHCTEQFEDLQRNEQFLSSLREKHAHGATRERDDSFPGYEVLFEVQSGGQGVVYAAEQRSTNRLVAIKVLRKDRSGEDRSQRRFEREIQLAASLRHPNLVPVFDSGYSERGHLFCVMELIDGEQLTAWLARQPARAERLDVFQKIAGAVQFAHQRGILHRDLKPANVLVDEQGEPRILDFGLALALEVEEDTTRETQVGQFLGTVAYAAPERMHGTPESSDVRVDVYSLGVMLYELLADQLPFEEGLSIPQMVRAASEGDLVPVERRCDVSRDLAAIVRKATATKQGDRYASVSELVLDLDHYRTGQPVAARAGSSWYLLRKAILRHRVAFAAGAVVFLSLAIATVVSLLALQSREEQRRLAVAKQEEALREASVAAAVAEFLTTTLSEVDPYRSGREVTMLDALGRASDKIANAFPEKPEVEAAVRTHIAQTYTSLGELSSAEPHAQRSLAIYCEQLGTEHPDTWRAKSNLAQLYREQGRFEEAEALCQELLAIDLPDDADIRLRVNPLVYLSNILAQRGESAPAESMALEALERSRQALGASHKKTLEARANLVSVHFQLGNVGESLAAAEALQRDSEEFFGRNDLRTLRATNQRTTILSASGDLATAEPLLRQLTESFRSVLGDKHYTTLNTTRALAVTVANLGRFAEAEEMLRETEPDLVAMLGNHHQDVVASRSSRASLLHRLGRHAEAETIYRDLLEQSEPGDRQALLATTELGVVVSAQGRHQEAEQILREVVAKLIQAVSHDHPQTIRRSGDLANCLRKMGRLEEADALFVETIEQAEDVLGPVHLATGDLRQLWAQCLLQMQLFEEAEEQLLLSLEARQQRGIDPQPVRQILARLYHEWGKPELAEEYRSADPLR